MRTAAQISQSNSGQVSQKGLKPLSRLSRPAWLRSRAPDGAEVRALVELLRGQHLHTVCEEANCPNLGECFRRGTATFMIMGDTCCRCCPFCNVKTGKPGPLDKNEPAQLVAAVAAMALHYVVLTSVTRDDLSDGGAGAFSACINVLRQADPTLKVEILVPDFRGKVGLALETLGKNLPDVFNHNIETVPRLYSTARPGADYQGSLRLLSVFKRRFPQVPTKSGLMVGLGERDAEIVNVMKDLRRNGCDLLTIGQYLSPSAKHLPVARYVTPEQFDGFRMAGRDLGFAQVAAGPLVRSSYNADAMTQALTRNPHE